MSFGDMPVCSAWELAAQAVGEIGKPWGIGIRLAKAELSFEDAFRPGEASVRQQRRGHSSFPCFAEVEPLDHRAFLAAGKLDQAAGVRRRDTESVDHLPIIESQELAGRHRGAKSTGQAGRVKTSSLKRVAGCNADA